MSPRESSRVTEASSRTATRVEETRLNSVWTSQDA